MKNKKKTRAQQKSAVYEIDKNVRNDLGMDVGLKILERSDMLASSTLEQLRKSTDRSYTLFGFLMTGFSAVTGLLLAAKESWLLIPGLILWTGLGVSLYIMFSQVMWVHSFRCTGNEPQNLISTRNIKMLREIYGSGKTLRKRYMQNLIYDSIEDCAYAIEVNDKALKNRVRMIELVMQTLKLTIYAVTISALVVFVFRIFNQ